MATIRLQDYLTQLNQLVDEGRYGEAINHCRHILRRYPRHVETYRVLARALLAQHEYEAAADVLQRILSADPNDGAAHGGMARVYQRRQEPGRALWHLERALERNPYDPALREELLQLYRTQTGRRPANLPLTPVALAHLYARGELYDLAIAELRQALAAQPDRVDLAVTLAESLWRSNQRVAAVDTCLQVLDRLPNCIQTNAILAEIWLLTGRVNEAQTYLKRLQDLVLVNVAERDGETAVYRAFAPAGAPPLPETILIEPLPDGKEADGAGQEAAWLAEADAVDQGADGVYTWLQDLEGQPDASLTADEADDDFPGEAVKADSDWFLDETATAIDRPEVDEMADLLRDWQDDQAPAPGTPGYLRDSDWFTDDADTGSGTIEDAELTDLLDEWSADGSASAAETGLDLPESDWFADEQSTAGAEGELDDLAGWIDAWEAEAQDEKPEVPSRPALDPAAWQMPEPASDLGDVPDWLSTATDNEFEPVHLSADESAEMLFDLAGLGIDEEEAADEEGTDWFAADAPAADVEETDWFAADGPAAGVEETDWFAADGPTAGDDGGADGSAAGVIGDDAAAERVESDWFGEPPAEEEAGLDDELAWLVDEAEAVETAVDPAAAAETAADTDEMPDWLMTGPLGAAAVLDTGAPGTGAPRADAPDAEDGRGSTDMLMSWLD
ncbi:MAG: tetratricopeptide repeat protein, partial [Anaerolineales bacterium]|nr:tetratricopeptide repeat protein [Anaerolineales bacterium]